MHGLYSHLVGLDDSSNEKQNNILLKGGQVARVNHPLKPWHPAACLTCDLFNNSRDGRPKNQELLAMYNLTANLFSHFISCFLHLFSASLYVNLNYIAMYIPFHKHTRMHCVV